MLFLCAVFRYICPQGLSGFSLRKKHPLLLHVRRTVPGDCLVWCRDAVDGRLCGATHRVLRRLAWPCSFFSQRRCTTSSTTLEIRSSRRIFMKEEATHNPALCSLLTFLQFEFLRKIANKPSLLCVPGLLLYTSGTLVQQQAVLVQQSVCKQLLGTKSRRGCCQPVLVAREFLRSLVLNEHTIGLRTTAVALHAYGHHT